MGYKILKHPNDKNFFKMAPVLLQKKNVMPVLEGEKFKKHLAIQINCIVQHDSSARKNRPISMLKYNNKLQYTRHKFKYALQS